MRLETKLFGLIDVEETQIFEFVPGLLGFEEQRRFALIQQDPSLPFAYLQAVEEPGIALLVADPFAFRRDYEFDLGDADLDALGHPAPEQLAIWVTVSTTMSMQNATVNLMAPLVLNLSGGKARQVVLHDSGYQSRTPLMQPEGEAR